MITIREKVQKVWFSFNVKFYHVVILLSKRSHCFLPLCHQCHLFWIWSQLNARNRCMHSPCVKNYVYHWFLFVHSREVTLLLVRQECLHLWVPRRNASTLQCWTCGDWLQSTIRVWRSSARLSGKIRFCPNRTSLVKVRPFLFKSFLTHGVVCNH